MSRGTWTPHADGATGGVGCPGWVQLGSSLRGPVDRGPVPERPGDWKTVTRHLHARASGRRGAPEQGGKEAQEPPEQV